MDTTQVNAQIEQNNKSINQIDFERQTHYLNPFEFNTKNYRIDVIGAGATGSYVVLQLAKMGLSNIHVWDKDTIESHNLPNQLYGLSDVGKSKVEALHDIILANTGIKIFPHNEFVDSNMTEPLGDIVFLLTDTMSSRKEIYESCLKLGSSSLCIETRLSATQGRIYSFDPTDFAMQDKWEKTLYSDAEAERSECGTTITMGASSSMMASMAVWQMIKWYKNSVPEFEILYSVAPNYNILTRK